MNIASSLQKCHQSMKIFCDKILNFMYSNLARTRKRVPWKFYIFSEKSTQLSLLSYFQPRHTSHWRPWDIPSGREDWRAPLRCNWRCPSARSRERSSCAWSTSACGAHNARILQSNLACSLSTPNWLSFPKLSQNWTYSVEFFPLLITYAFQLSFI